MKDDLQTTAEEAAGPAVMMGLRGRQEVHEGGIALDHRAHQRREPLVAEGKAVLQPADQLRLRRDDALRGGDRQISLPV